MHPNAPVTRKRSSAIVLPLNRDRPMSRPELSTVSRYETDRSSWPRTRPFDFEWKEEEVASERRQFSQIPQQLDKHHPLPQPELVRRRTGVRRPDTDPIQPQRRHPAI